MTTQLNTWSDLSSIAQSVQEDAVFAVREVSILPNLALGFNDMAGGNTRRNYGYNENTAGTIGETTDLTSVSFAATAMQTLTPKEIGMQYFVTDLRAASESPDRIVSDAARDLGLAAADKVEYDLFALFSSLTGGSAGGTGTSGTPTWGFIAAAIAQARNANKRSNVPLACVMHGYTWAVLAKAASIAGASIAQAPGFSEEVTRSGYVGSFMGVPLYQVYQDVTGTGATAWAYGAVFPREAIALDWRRPIRVEAERDASLRGVEFNMSAVYAAGVWRPELGVYFCALAATPTS
jgi:hypothetical protein